MISWVSLFLLIMVMLCLVTVLWILWKILKTFQKTQESQERVAIAQTEVLSKALSLLSAQDAMTYQAIQAMESPSFEPDQPEINVIDDTPPSNDEWDRLYDKHLRGEAMSADEQARFERGFAAA